MVPPTSASVTGAIGIVDFGRTPNTSSNITPELTDGGALTGSEGEGPEPTAMSGLVNCDKGRDVEVGGRLN